MMMHGSANTSSTTTTTTTTTTNTSTVTANTTNTNTIKNSSSQQQLAANFKSSTLNQPSLNNLNLINNNNNNNTASVVVNMLQQDCSQPGLSVQTAFRPTSSLSEQTQRKLEMLEARFIPLNPQKVVFFRVLII